MKNIFLILVLYLFCSQATQAQTNLFVGKKWTAKAYYMEANGVQAPLYHQDSTSNLFDFSFMELMPDTDSTYSGKAPDNSNYNGIYLIDSDANTATIDSTEYTITELSSANFILRTEKPHSNTDTINYFLHLVPSSVLPVELSDFKAMPEGRYNKISWTTDTELNTDYFELERRIQGGGWKLIERIDAAGYSESTKSYSCLDEFPVAENYYRLKSVDIDGSFEYSELIYLDRKDLNILLSNIYINQISNNLIIRFNTDLSTEKTSIKLFDVNGRTIYKLIDTPLKESGEFMIDMNNYPAGVYFISVYVNDSRQIEKVIKH